MPQGKDDNVTSTVAVNAINKGGNCHTWGSSGYYEKSRIVRLLARLGITC